MESSSESQQEPEKTVVSKGHILVATLYHWCSMYLNMKNHVCIAWKKRDQKIGQVHLLHLLTLFINTIILCIASYCEWYSLVYIVYRCLK